MLAARSPSWRSARLQQQLSPKQQLFYAAFSKLFILCGREPNDEEARRTQIVGNLVTNDRVANLEHPLCIFVFLDAFSHLYKRVCLSVRPLVPPSVGPSVRHTRVEFRRNGPNSNKIASGIRKYAIQKTIPRQVRGQFARERICCPNSVRLVLSFLNIMVKLFKQVKNSCKERLHICL